METEWHYLPDRGEVMVNVTDVYGSDLDNLLAEIEGEYMWTGADYMTDRSNGVVEQWMFLLGATKRSNGLSTGSPSGVASEAGMR